MYNFGDELTLETYRVPWLIWIQVIVMVLLLLLLYCFSMLVLDLPDDNTKPSSSSTRLVSSHNFTTTVSTHRLQSTQGAQQHHFVDLFLDCKTCRRKYERRDSTEHQ
ncbi:uncharacterized protein LOC133708127 isoform X2 [Rosa rugosa]|uniref:uncharacterized protein LOC133708127 isoform X2 n=1 Tax=Rosa rugosa TaxID=74645 RepID=UPI002B405C26|nr:uncharacterized protein LOC133708127 isoform X2 [Rosa rugosa]